MLRRDGLKHLEGEPGHCVAHARRTQIAGDTKLRRRKGVTWGHGEAWNGGKETESDVAFSPSSFVLGTSIPYKEIVQLLTATYRE